MLPREHKTREFAHSVQQEINDETVTLYSFSTGARTGVNGECTGSDDHSVLAFYGRELGKEVDSLAQRFNAENPDYKIVPTYKGNYEQNLSAGLPHFVPATLRLFCRFMKLAPPP